MNLSDTKYIVVLKREFGYRDRIEYSVEHEELLFIGEMGVVVTDLTGKKLYSHCRCRKHSAVGPRSQIVASKRTNVGWLILFCEEDCIKCFLVNKVEMVEVILKQTDVDVCGAAWSRGGKYIALASKNGKLEIFDALKGKILQTGIANIENPNNLQLEHYLLGWSKTGNEVVSVIKRENDIFTVIWDSKTGTIKTIIEP